MHQTDGAEYDVAIVGGGPAGLSAALALGRARKRVLLCDSGLRRNAAAEHIHNFVTRDGTPPNEFRRIAREQLSAYPDVQAREASVEGIAGSRGAFRVVLQTETVRARRVLLCTGMVDQMLSLPGFQELWGRSIFQCPYCHGWEIRERPWGYLALAANQAHLLPFTFQLRGWTDQLTVFTGGSFEVFEEAQARMLSAGIRVETAPVVRLRTSAGSLEAVELANGTAVPCQALFAHPPQLQVALVRALDPSLDDEGYVLVDPARAETSIPGVYAAGDLTTRVQGAVIAAAAGMRAAAVINVDLNLEHGADGP